MRQKNTDLCWDVQQSHKDSPVLLWHCHTQGGNQYFFYDPETKLMRQGKNNRCLDCDATTKKLFTNECDESKDSMKWTFATVNRTAIEAWRKETLDLANMTLAVQTSSWYMGANVPGKKREYLLYMGGMDLWHSKCQAALKDWQDFDTTRAISAML